jgi:hypothetical protein
MAESKAGMGLPLVIWNHWIEKPGTDVLEPEQMAGWKVEWKSEWLFSLPLG